MLMTTVRTMERTTKTATKTMIAPSASTYQNTIVEVIRFLQSPPPPVWGCFQLRGGGGWSGGEEYDDDEKCDGCDKAPPPPMCPPSPSYLFQ